MTPTRRIQFYLQAMAIRPESQAFKQWFRNSKVVDDHGNPLPCYHGTGRPDRIGEQFRKSRATAGPMSYFTDDPEVASGYAHGKPDTSLTHPDSEAEWFKVKWPGERRLVSVVDTWHWLSQAQRQEMLKLAPTVTRDDDLNIIQDPSCTAGPGGLDYTLKVNKGNMLKALAEQWIAGGVLFNDEREFIQVLKLAGYPYKVEMQDPSETTPAVYQVYLSIQNPLDTANVSDRLVDDIIKASSRVRFKDEDGGFGQWNKKSLNPKYWVAGFKEDIAKGTANVWTAVPDWVTKVLEAHGYDGIKDRGGKHRPDKHTVWIPFRENQVKSATSSSFNLEHKNIRR